jgi:hypothetical protein
MIYVPSHWDGHQSTTRVIYTYIYIYILQLYIYVYNYNYIYIMYSCILYILYIIIYIYSIIQYTIPITKDSGMDGAHLIPLSLTIA